MVGLALAALSAALATFQVSGCTVIDPIVGGIVDSARKDRSPLGRSVEGPVLAEAVRCATIPLTTTVDLDTHAGPVEVPLHDVLLVQGPAPKGGKVIGFIVGLGTDIALVAAVAAAP